MIDDSSTIWQKLQWKLMAEGMRHCNTGECKWCTRSSNICLRIQATRACTWLAALGLELEPIRVAGNLNG